MKSRNLPVLLTMIVFSMLLAACAGITTRNVPETRQAAAPPAWDTVFVAPDCLADKRAPLLAEALENSGLDRFTFGFSETDLKKATYYKFGYAMPDGFSPPLSEALIQNPARAGCIEGEAAGALDYYLEQDHPVAGIIRHATTLLGIPLDTRPPLDSTHLPGDFGQAISAICHASKNSDEIDYIIEDTGVSTDECNIKTGKLPAELAEALTPIMWAILEGVEARKKMDAETSNRYDPEWWWSNGDGLVSGLTGEASRRIVPKGFEHRRYLLGVGGRRALYAASARIAFAIEDADLQRFAGLMGVNFELHTPAGWIIVRDAADHVYPDDDKDTLLFLELGGNDEYLNPVASNTSPRNPVSIAIDLEGTDVYHYETQKTPYDRDGLLPADKHGRLRGDEYSGNISLSHEYRQGAARNGIAMLFDFGKGEDSYQSLRCSQGCAYLGVAVLFDDGGTKNTFLAEDMSQGMAQFGIALNIVAGEGENHFESFSHSQGYGYVGGVAIHVSKGGKNSYICNIGDPKLGGIPLYYTPQRPGKGNSSFCQGAGQGRRTDDRAGQKEFLSGGIGILRNICGDTTYVSSIMAGGFGYWQGGMGILSDGCGDDTFDILQYGGGSGAHYASGIAAFGGKGTLTVNRAYEDATHNVVIGASNDLSVGVFINEERDATINVTGLSMGASTCNSIGLFVQNSGESRFIASSNNNSATASSGCEDDRPDPKGVALMIVVGENTYEYPDGRGSATPNAGLDWGHTASNLPSEHAAGLDRIEGETGIHVESSRVK